MFRIRYSVLTFGREISLKVLPYVTLVITGFFRVTIKVFQRCEESAN